MKLNDIMKLASEAYCKEEPDLFAGYWDFDKGEPRLGEDGKVVHDPVDGRNDGLVRYIVIELMETYDEEASEDEQLTEARVAVDGIVNSVNNIGDALWVKVNSVR
jgi:hypothetical protein